MTPGSPVLFLVFNRPDTTARVFAAIREARPPRLYVAADGPRADREDEAERCDEVRRIATAVDWPCEVKTLFRDANLGCRRAVSGALTWFFEQEDEGIILEDDCLPDPSFFRYCAEMLAYWRHDARVMAVCGDNTLTTPLRFDTSYRFSSYTLVWGWATWARAWAHYDFERFRRANHAKIIAGLTRKRHMRRARSRIMAGVAAGEIDSWAYPWSFTVWELGGYTTVPAVNLVSNIGFGTDATHTRVGGGHRAARATTAMTFPLRHAALGRDPSLDTAIETDIHRISPPPPVWRRAQRRLSRALMRLR